MAVAQGASVEPHTADVPTAGQQGKGDARLRETRPVHVGDGRGGEGHLVEQEGHDACLHVPHEGQCVLGIPPSRFYRHDEGPGEDRDLLCPCDAQPETEAHQQAVAGHTVLHHDGRNDRCRELCEGRVVADVTEVEGAVRPQRRGQWDHGAADVLPLTDPLDVLGLAHHEVVGGLRDGRRAGVHCRAVVQPTNRVVGKGEGRPHRSVVEQRGHALDGQEHLLVALHEDGRGHQVDGVRVARVCLELVARQRHIAADVRQHRVTERRTQGIAGVRGRDAEHDARGLPLCEERSVCVDDLVAGDVSQARCMDLVHPALRRPRVGDDHRNDPGDGVPGTLVDRTTLLDVDRQHSSWSCPRHRLQRVAEWVRQRGVGGVHLLGEVDLDLVAVERDGRRNERRVYLGAAVGPEAKGVTTVATADVDLRAAEPARAIGAEAIG